jgi:AraC-like DNA-binding protein
MTHSMHDVIQTFKLDRGDRFGMHHHNSHQLVWALDGTLRVHAASRVWTLSSSRALWIPPYVDHDVIAVRAAMLRTIYLHESDVAPGTAAPVTIEIDDLIRSVINHLADGALEGDERAHVEVVLFDRFRGAPRNDVSSLSIALPKDDRARRVALAVVEHPGDQRSLRAWGEWVGASARTLSRLFHAETGLTFDEWRRVARMHAAFELLTSGVTVEQCAHLVGYAGASAFGVAYRTTFGHAPTATRR